MSKKTTWKSKFLSSSMPLEYEVAKILADLNFSVSFDYPYYRQEDGHKKEFSTDIKGYFLFPLDSEDEINASLTLLTECKYRDESKKWAFIPDVNRPDFSSFTLGTTIKSLSEFSKVKNKEDLIPSFEEHFNYALKGVEINIENGNVFDKDIRHGISQLKYALPYLIKENIMQNVFDHIDNTVPAYLVSILVTNAELYILNNNLSINKIKEINELEEVARQVPYLICYSESGPDFMDHHKKIFDNLNYDVVGNGNLEEFEAFHKSQKELYVHDSPIRTCINLEESHYYTLHRYYHQHFICSFDFYKDLIKQILELLSEVTKIGK